MKTSPNTQCPCGSKIKYHKGAITKDVLTLMRSRYSAYVSRETMYIVKTTDQQNPQYQEDEKKWAKEIDDFCKTTTFNKLEILDHDETTVTFKAYTKQGVLHEKSIFVKVDSKWFYLDGEIYS